MSPKLRFTVIERGALGAHAPALNDLAAAALEPNPFYEPWMLLPAIDSYGPPGLQFVLAHAETSGAPPLLCGFFPLEHKRFYRGLPILHARLWRYIHCYLGTPLLRASHARVCLQEFTGWLARRGLRAVEWGLVGADGPFFQLLLEEAYTFGRPSFSALSYTRALMKRRADAQAYFVEAFSNKHRQEFRRLERRLGEMGAVTYEALQPQRDAAQWIGDFVRLEATGWKGRLGSALGSNEANQRFFMRAATDAARHGRLMMLKLSVAGKPVAMKCNFAAAPGAFAFKIAYDEQFARYSPGTLLELENIRRFHAQQDLQWMDSCAQPDHFLMNRVSLDRRAVATVVSATGGTAAQLLVSALPRLRDLWRWIRPSRLAATSLLASPSLPELDR